VVDEANEICTYCNKKEMSYNYNKSLVTNSQTLRKNMTPEEKQIWYNFLKRLPYTVNRQKVIGNYIVDFYIAEKRTVIEIDGVQHKTKENEEKDKQRDAELNDLDIKVLRYTNKAVNTVFNKVCDDILMKLGLTVNELKPAKSGKR
jgi:very-short-patch-repair endonuclease